MSLLNGPAIQHSSDYESLIQYVVCILGMLVLKKACAREYLYYQILSPWLQIKLLKVLINRMVRHPMSQLTSIVSKILTETDALDSISKSNTDHAKLFKAVNLIVTLGQTGLIQLRKGAAGPNTRRSIRQLCNTDNAEHIMDEREIKMEIS
eukprot:766166-Ditylum_brightwellii.AAC.1